ncbi:MAG: hypothetical protein IH597_07490 [Bacteroidales bacterium]|nr:hypothetical protein [Bacteroidales bacterium]
MNNLIIIGNGFDLAHELKTSYADFMLWYLNKTRKWLINNLEYEDDICAVKSFPRNYFLTGDQPFNSISNAFESFKNRNINIYPKSEFVDGLLKDMRNGYWVDIEYFYYSHLVSIYRDYERNFSKYDIDAKASAKSLNRCFSAIISLLEQYLSTLTIDENKRNPFISKTLKGIIKPERNKNKLVNPPYTLLLNFNYTNTLDLYAHDLDMSNSRTNVVNIHGLINSEINPVIFGYGDEMDPYYPKLENLNINSFLDHIKSFHYLKTTNYLQLMRFVEADPFVIYIMGHSCGLSDRVLLNSIFEHDKCSNIKIYYHDRKDGSNDYFEKTQEISRHFKPENKAMMRKKIVPFEKCSPLT